MENNMTSRSQAFQHFHHAIVAMADLDWCQTHASILDCEHRPVLSLSEQRAHRHCQNVTRTPDRGMHDHPVVVAKPRPKLRRIGEVDGHANPLFLDAEGRYFEESG